MEYNAKKVGSNLTEGNLLKSLLAFALPILLTSFIQQTYNSVDTIIVGRYVGSTGTVGVSTGGEIVGLLMYVGNACGNAGQIYISQLVGAKKQHKIADTIGTLLTTTILLSVIFVIGNIILVDPLLRMLNTPQEALQQAKNYMTIVALGLPATMCYSAISGVMRGMGESKRPLLFVSISAVVNIALDLLLVVAIPMEAAGTAIATIASQYACLFAAVILMYKERVHFGFDFKPKSFRMHMEPLQVIIKLGLPQLAKSMLIHCSQIYCSAMVNDYGLVASATNSIGKKVSKFINLFTNSIDTGAATMVGQCLGAKKPDRAKKAVYTALAFGTCFSAIAVVVAIFFPREVFGLYTHDAEVIELGVTYMRILIISIILAAVQGAYQAMITGSGFAMLGMLSGILDGVVLRIGISLFLSRVMDMGLLGFFYGEALARLGPVVIGVAYFYSGKWKTRMLLSEDKQPKAAAKR